MTMQPEQAIRWLTLAELATQIADVEITSRTMLALGPSLVAAAGASDVELGSVESSDAPTVRPNAAE